MCKPRIRSIQAQIEAMDHEAVFSSDEEEDRVDLYCEEEYHLEPHSNAADEILPDVAIKNNPDYIYPLINCNESWPDWSDSDSEASVQGSDSIFNTAFFESDSESDIDNYLSSDNDETTPEDNCTVTPEDLQDVMGDSEVTIICERDAYTKISKHRTTVKYGALIVPLEYYKLKKYAARTGPISDDDATKILTDILLDNGPSRRRETSRKRKRDDSNDEDEESRNNKRSSSTE